MNYGEMLLSKVIDTNDVKALNRFAIDSNDFATQGERNTYKFIMDYAETNKGNAPDYRTVVAKCPEFTYIPQVEDGYEYLAKQIKSHSIKVNIMNLVNNELPNAFDSNDGQDTADWILDKIQSIKQQANFRTKVGTNLKSDSKRFLDEYKRRKNGESFKVWKSKFPSINKAIGGYLGGNVYTWYGRSGRGKSIYCMEEGLESAFEGATVLIWAMEMSEFEWLARAYSSISARLGIFNATIDGIDYEAGFDSMALLMGKLGDKYEELLAKFLDTLNSKIKGEIIIRSVDHEDFYNRGCKELESDILQTRADVVIIDPFYYMDYESNTSRTTGGDAANTSKKLRHISGFTKSVIHVITQADEIKDELDEDGNRELSIPPRSAVLKTKAVLHDAVNTFGIDSIDGRGVIGIGKGRNGGEGVEVDILYLPNFGIVKEVVPQEVASQFDDFI